EPLQRLDPVVPALVGHLPARGPAARPTPDPHAPADGLPALHQPRHADRALHGRPLRLVVVHLRRRGLRRAPAPAPPARQRGRHLPRPGRGGL
ncbi:MAG: hypothetical protein AVDCRST_MAG48-540, partial [uncultured Friedmanniella sp.]